MHSPCQAKRPVAPIPWAQLHRVQVRCPQLDQPHPAAPPPRPLLVHQTPECSPDTSPSLHRLHSTPSPPNVAQPHSNPATLSPRAQLCCFQVTITPLSWPHHITLQPRALSSLTLIASAFLQGAKLDHSLSTLPQGLATAPTPPFLTKLQFTTQPRLPTYTHTLALASHCLTQPDCLACPSIYTKPLPFTTTSQPYPWLAPPLFPLHQSTSQTRPCSYPSPGTQFPFSLRPALL